MAGGDAGGEGGHGAEALPRVKSGIRRLDFILRGGLVEGGLYSLLGPPGSGKTIFCNQFCFHHVEDGGSCVYVTLLTESHVKMLRHLSTLSFFRPEKIPEKMFYVSGYQTLRDRGLDGLQELLRTTLKERRPSMLVIDGVESVIGAAENDRRAKEFMHALQSFTAMIGCTTIVSSQQNEGSHPENAIADGILEFTDLLVGPRAVRELVVHKFRGSAYLRGRHELEITENGIVIHPRTEVQFASPPEHAQERRERMGFGLTELDQMMDGGIPSGSTAAILGSPGTGKTLLCLHYLIDGAKKGQSGIYFGFYEPPPRLIEKAESIGLPLREYVDKGLIELLWQPPLESMLDSLAEQILEKIKAERKPRRRLVIDGIEGFRAASIYPRMPLFLSAFTNQLRATDTTTVVTEELELFKPHLDMPNPELANVVETVVLLRYVEVRSQIRRLLSIMKMRESKYDTSIRQFDITDDGVKVERTFESAERILSGRGRLLAGGPGEEAE